MVISHHTFQAAAASMADERQNLSYVQPRTFSACNQLPCEKNYEARSAREMGTKKRTKKILE